MINVYASALEPGQKVRLDGVRDRRILLQVISGDLDVNGEWFAAGDGARIHGVETVEIAAANDSEFLLLNLA